MLRLVLQRAAVTNYRRVLASSMVVPQDAPRASSGHEDALRVLVLGSGVASGQGVGTYGLALVGALQRALGRGLERPVDVELVRQHGAGIDRAATIARPRLGERWDAYVLAFGVRDALRLTPLDEWTRGIGTLLSAIEDAKPSPFRVPVVIAGVPPLSSFQAHRGPLLATLDRHAERFNAVTRELADRHGAAAFVPLPAVEIGGLGDFGSSSAYSQWAEVIADRLVPMLRFHPQRVAIGDEGADLPDVLLPPAAAERRRLARLVARAREACDADLAAVRLVHRDRVVSVVDTLDGPPSSSPLQMSVTERTMAAGALLVEDLAYDERFAQHPLLTFFGVRSYVGVALRGDEGRPVGSLCVLGGGAGRAGQDEVLLDLVRRSHEERMDDRPPACPPGPPLVEHGGTGLLPVPSARARRAGVGEGARLLETLSAARPPAARRYEIAGPDPVRILLLGGELMAGHGAPDREHAFDGALARLVHRRTGCGVEVVNRADADIPVGRTAALVDAAGGDGPPHLVVWGPSLQAAAGGTGARAWRRGVGDLLDRVRVTSGAGVVLTGLPVLEGHHALAALGRSRAHRFDRVLRAAAARHPGAVVAPPGPLLPPGPGSQRQLHRAAAVHAFDSVLTALQAAAR